MGYQESYVRVKDTNKFEELIKLTKDLGKEFFRDKELYPVEIITLEKDINGDLEMMCRPDIKYNFKKGEKFLYFVGQRHCQRCGEYMYEEYKPQGLEIFFTECFPSSEIFDKNSGYAKMEKFEF